MNPDEAADLAARTLDAIDVWTYRWPGLSHRRADRERVASDLAGLREHRPTDGRAVSAGWDIVCAAHHPMYPRYPCVDAARYAEGLRRTARLYGVE